MKKISNTKRQKDSRQNVSKGGLNISKNVLKISNARSVARVSKNIKWLIGIDEVGRGPLAGPVAVCACIMPYHKSPEESYKKFLKKYEKDIKAGGLRDLTGKDSKKLREKDREMWMNFLSKISKEESVAEEKIHFIYGEMSAKQIDNKGIAVCIKDLIKKHLDLFDENFIDAVNAMVLLDGGLKAPERFLNQKTIIKGDEKELVISLASIYAKVSRDSYMKRISKKDKYNKYMFDIHKGYGTKVHMEKIKAYGFSDLHRKSFLRSLLTK